MASERIWSLRCDFRKVINGEIFEYAAFWDDAVFPFLITKSDPMPVLSRNRLWRLVAELIESKNWTTPLVPKLGLFEILMTNKF